MTTVEPHTRRLRLTPGRFVLALLAVEGLLWLSDRFGWLGWHKGYAVLTCVASVGVFLLLMLGSFAASLLFRRRFQFSLRSLLALVVVVALPCSWLAVEMKKARDVTRTAGLLSELGCTVFGDDATNDDGHLDWTRPAWIKQYSHRPWTRAWTRRRNAAEIRWLMSAAPSQPGFAL